MNPDQQKQLNENWLAYQEAKAKAAAEGLPAIGTFGSWQFENKLVDISIPKTREEHFLK